MNRDDLDAHGQPRMRWNEPWLLDQQVDELLGWCHGVLCDGELNEKEVAALDFWIQTHPEAQRHWQVQALEQRMRKIMVDGVLDSDETEELKQLLHALVGGEVAMPQRTSTSLPHGCATARRRIHGEAVLPDRSVPDGHATPLRGTDHEPRRRVPPSDPPRPDIPGGGDTL